MTTPKIDNHNHDVESSRLDVLIIGKNLTMIDDIHATHYSENEVMAEKWMESTGIIPDAIIINKDCSLSHATMIKEVLIKHDVDKKIPLLLMTDYFNQSEMNVPHKVDDVITKDITAKMLDYRIRVFSNPKMKDRKVGAGNKRTVSIPKRMFDVVSASCALILASPFLVLVAILIKIDSKGPIFYVSKRVGTGYKVFDFYKFRTMKVGADQNLEQYNKLNQYKEAVADTADEDRCPECEKLGSFCSTPLYLDEKVICEESYKKKLSADKAGTFFKLKDDPRITKLGAFLRQTSIDEIPQLFNVVKGDMSIVGNRPLPVYEAQQLTSDHWAKRFLAPAGLTGLWQVTKRGKSDMSESERKELDNTYASNHSFVGDIVLMLKTVPALLQKEKV